MNKNLLRASFLLTGIAVLAGESFFAETATFVIAASDSLHAERADFRCDGVDDQAELKRAIKHLPAAGGRIVLLEGTYSWFDSLRESPPLPDDLILEGQGPSTRIVLKSDVTPFVLRARVGVSIRRLAVELALGDAHSEEVFEISARARGELSYDNTIEEVSITNKGPGVAPGYTGIRLYAADEGGGAGVIPAVFRNLVRQVRITEAKAGIVIETAGAEPWINGNAFEFVFIHRFATGVEFVHPPAPFAGANRNRFTDLKMQTAPYSVDGFKDIGRRGNVFVDCLVWDWHLAAAPQHAWSVHESGEGTYIQTTAMDDDFADAGSRTILLENGNASFGGELEVAGERLHVSAEGDVGIGTDNPLAKLSLGRDYLNIPSAVDQEVDAIGFVTNNLAETRAKIAVFQESTGVTAWADLTGLGFFTESGGPGNNIAERMRIDGYGRVGIGTTKPTSRLDLDGAHGYDQLRLRRSFTPTGSADPRGNEGDVAWDDQYVYVKTSAGWKRAGLGVW